MCFLLGRVERVLGFDSELYKTLNEARMQAVSDAPAGWALGDVIGQEEE